MQPADQRHQRMAKHAACCGLSHGRCGHVTAETHQEGGG